MATIGQAIVVKATGLRPKLAWAHGRPGIIIARPRGKSVHCRVTDAAGRQRSVRLALTDFV